MELVRGGGRIAGAAGSAEGRRGSYRIRLGASWYRARGGGGISSAPGGRGCGGVGGYWMGIGGREEEERPAGLGAWGVEDESKRLRDFFFQLSTDKWSPPVINMLKTS